MRLNNIALFCFIALVGCASSNKDTAVHVEPQIVEVPVAVSCKQEIPPTPDYCFYRLKEEDTIYTKTSCMLSDIILSKGYEIELLARLSACK